MNIVLLYTSGLDSTVLLYELLHQGHHVKALGIDFGEAHKKLHLGQETCHAVGVEFKTAEVRCDNIFRNNEIPNRDLTMLSLAAGWAMETGSDSISAAKHNLSDLDGLLVYEMAIHRLTDRRIWIYTPFLNMSKAEIIRVGAARNVPFAQTWSCLKGGEYHCGQCASCVERRESFQQAQVHDPTQYQ